MRRALLFAVVYAVIAAGLVAVGIEAVWPMLIPPALCALPLAVSFLAPRPVARRVTAVSAALLLLLSLLGSMSVGGLFLPSVIALWVALGAPDWMERPTTRPAGR